jgi:hypothetical protein
VKNLQVNFLLRARVPIEKHATRVYTRALFERFFRELFRSGALICTDNGGGDTFIVRYARTRSDEGGIGREYIVKCNGDRSDYLCSCKYFEHSGIPCHHILKVCFSVSFLFVPC